MMRFLAACALTLLLCANAQAQVAPMPTGEWTSYNPNRGDRMPAGYGTGVRVAYDDRAFDF